MKVLIKEIASKANVSIATVSRVMNNSDYVKEETRTRVENALKELKSAKEYFGVGERKNVQSIAIITPNISNSFFSEVIEGIEELCFKNDLLPIIFNSKESEEVEEVILKRVKNLKLSGVILTPVSTREKQGKTYLEQLKNLKTPIVFLDRSLYYGDYTGVYIDNLYGGILAVEAFVNGGHRNIGMIRGPKTSKSGEDRYSGYKRGLELNFIEKKEEFVVEGDFGIESGYQGMKTLLSGKKRPTAVFISNNMMALGALNYLREMLITPGKDISIIVFDELLQFGDGNKNITTVSYSAHKMGQITGEILIERLKKDEREDETIQKITLRPTIYLRGSEKLELESRVTKIDEQRKKEEIRRSSEENSCNRKY